MHWVLSAILRWTAPAIPYVEQFTRESGVTHCEIETEFDNMLLRRDGYDPLKFFTASHIHPSEQNAKAIAPFYEGISEQVALDSLKGMISVHRLLQASNPVKRWVVLTGMKVVGKYDMLHGLVADPQPNPKCVESGKRLEELYAQALPLAETLILEFVAKLDTDQPLSKAYDPLGTMQASRERCCFPGSFFRRARQKYENKISADGGPF